MRAPSASPLRDRLIECEVDATIDAQFALVEAAVASGLDGDDVTGIAGATGLRERVLREMRRESGRIRVDDLAMAMDRLGHDLVVAIAPARAEGDATAETLPKEGAGQACGRIVADLMAAKESPIRWTAILAGLNETELRNAIGGRHQMTVAMFARAMAGLERKVRLAARARAPRGTGGAETGKRDRT